MFDVCRFVLDEIDVSSSAVKILQIGFCERQERGVIYVK